MNKELTTKERIKKVDFAIKINKIIAPWFFVVFVVAFIVLSIVFVEYIPLFIFLLLIPTVINAFLYPIMMRGYKKRRQELLAQLEQEQNSLSY
ncbi:MAG: hypothetical protein FWD58_07010 [Firmicutes bacterium]|nr:hypothetical protein [Bacillota bacterium]